MTDRKQLAAWAIRYERVEQERDRLDANAKEFYDRLNEAEARLAKVPPLVEALREASEALDAAGCQVAASDAHQALALYEQAAQTGNE